MATPTSSRMYLPPERPPTGNFMFSVRQSESDCTDLLPGWTQLHQRYCELPSSSGPMGHPALTFLAHRVLAPSTEINILCLEDRSGSPVAILPYCAEYTGSSLLRARHLRCITNLYPGRGGILQDPENRDTAERLFSNLLTSLRWDQLTITTVGDSTSESALRRAAKDNRYSPHILLETQIPYIEFPPTWEEYFSSLAKKFRYTIRSAEKQLEKLGKLEVKPYADPADCEEFLQNVATIEKNSWKEDAGSSLTQQPLQGKFHSELAPVAAALDMLRGYVLFSGARPIAHIYGLQHGHVFCDLKESFDEEFATYSPGSVLKAMVMREIVGKTIRCWDFIGRAEFHKLRWTKKTYTQRTWFLFSHSSKGRLLAWRNKLSSTLRKAHILPAPASDFGRPA